MSTTYRKRKIKYKRKKNLKMTTIKSCQYRKIMSRTRGKIPTTTGHKKKRERKKSGVSGSSMAKLCQVFQRFKARHAEGERQTLLPCLGLALAYLPTHHSLTPFFSPHPSPLHCLPLSLQSHSYSRSFFFFLDINAITSFTFFVSFPFALSFFFFLL